MTHDGVSTSGVVGKPSGPGAGPPVFIENLPAGQVFSQVVCTGATPAGPAHPPGAPPANQVVAGSSTVLIHNAPAARMVPSGDTAACTAMLGNPVLGMARTVLIGGTTEVSTLAMSRSLIVITGSADAHDGELVAEEMAALPPHMLQVVIDGGGVVAVCRGSVTDHRTDLRGVQPRGWDPGQTWDIVPGLNSPTRNEVVIATVGHGTPEGAHVPRAGEGHGSANLVLHEVGHNIDANAPADQNSSSADFTAARTPDVAGLSAYEQQAGTAGLEETYAESIARYYGGDATDAVDHPNLNSHWDSDPMAPDP